MDPDSVNVERLLLILFEAIKSGNVTLIAALGLMGAVALVRLLFGEKLPFLKSDLGASLFTFVLGAFGTLVTAIASGGAISIPLIIGALKTTFLAMGGYSFLKKLILPLLSKIIGSKVALAKSDAVVIGTVDGLKGFVKDAEEFKP